MSRREELMALARRVEAAQGADRICCDHCGVRLPASCPADQGFGCPSWEDFKDREAEAAALRALAEEVAE